MNQGESRHLSRLLLDDRGVLGAIVFCLSWFVGTTFNTQVATLSWFAIAVLTAVTLRAYQRRTSAGTSYPVGTSYPAGTSYPVGTSNALGKLEGDGVPAWREAGKTLLLLACLGLSSLLIFSWRFIDQASDASNTLVLSVDTIGHGCVAMACILWAVRSTNGHVLLLIFGMVAVLMAIAGGGVSSTLTAQMAVGLASCIAFLIAAQIIIGRNTKSNPSRVHAFRSNDKASEVLPLTTTGPRNDSKERFSFSTTTWPFTLLIVSLILIVASAIARVADQVLPRVQAEVFSQLKDRFEDPTSTSLFASGRYVVGNRIGEVQTSLLTNPNALALRGYCNSPPGYLRGNVFDDYSDGRWNTKRRWIRIASQRDGRQGRFNSYRARIIQSISNAKVPLSENAKPSRARFPLNVFDATEVVRTSDGSVVPRTLGSGINKINGGNGVEEDERLGTGSNDGFGEESDDDSVQLANSTLPIIGTIEIYGEPDRGQQTFFPLNSVWIESRAQRIGITPHRLIDRGIDNDQPWVVGVAADALIEPLNASERGLMSWVDPRIRPKIRQVARAVAGDQTSARSKASAIANYFQNEYTYTLRPAASPAGNDPIVHFLETQHAAHCEFFASASTLMLRTLDVPTRYVTGYVMDQLDDDGDYYVAFNRDAHAWVEYYDESINKWVSLETTPGRTFQTMQDAATAFDSVALNDSGYLDQSVSSSWLRGFFGYLASLRVTDTLSVIFQILQIPALLVLVGWLWWHAREAPGDETAQMQIAKRNKMDRQLRRWGWVRSATETLHQFAERLESVPVEHPRFNDLQSASDWYRRHAIELYRGTTNEMPSPQ